MYVEPVWRHWNNGSATYPTSPNLYIKKQYVAVIAKKSVIMSEAFLVDVSIVEGLDGGGGGGLVFTIH